MTPWKMILIINKNRQNMIIMNIVVLIYISQKNDTLCDEIDNNSDKSKEKGGN